MPPPMPSLLQALRLWAGKPIRWVPPLLSLILIFWLFGPSFYYSGPPPPHHLNAGLPPPIGHPHQPPNRIPLDSEIETSVWPTRADQVRKAFIHAYEGYRANAFRADELLPVSGKKIDNFNGWGVTLYDALDTMWIMGLDDYFNEALEIVAQADFMISPFEYASFFETVIRYLGGLLSAYSLSGKSVLLEKADELGGLLLPAFNTKSGFPMFSVNPQNKRVKGSWASGTTLWSEAMTCQMEYKYLAHLTGKREYFDKAERVMQIMYDSNITDGLFPTMWNTETAEPTNDQFSVGAFADSAHEYLLKQWLLTGRSETKIRDLYLQASHAIIHNLLYLPPDRDFLYVTDTHFTPSNKSHPHSPSHNFEHLSCFLPGLLALGHATLKESDFPSADERELHLWAAEGLAYACWLSYADQKTGLGPDEMGVNSWPQTDSETTSAQGRWVDLVDKWKKDGKPHRRPPGLREAPPENRSDKRGYINKRPTYVLRPESVESFYILWRSTGDEKWRERGWAIFESIERHTKTEHGYATIEEVDSDAPFLKDQMPSFFLAETLKYLYLLFTDDEIMPLDKWVFNTEAHPLPIFEWTAEEKAAYRIS